MSADLIRRHQSYEPEAYHELIDRQSRYATLFVPISPAEAAALLAVYGARFISRADACTPEHLAAIQGLNARLEKVLADSAGTTATAGANGGAAAGAAGADEEKKEYFVRLSSRSPKDGIPLGADQLRTALTQLMHEHGVTQDLAACTTQPIAALKRTDGEQKTDQGNDDDNQEDEGTEGAEQADDTPTQQAETEVNFAAHPALAMEYDALLSSGLTAKQMNDMACSAFALMHEFMRVSAAGEVLALLTSSERVAIDLSRALDAYVEDPSSWRQHICLRAWERRIQDRFEFRCFVHENRLTAISQYNTYVCIDELANDPDFRRLAFTRLVDAWKQNFQHVLSEIGSYVCDLAYCRETDDVILIELNPPEPTTGSGLFDWQRDAHILTGPGHTACRDPFSSDDERKQGAQEDSALNDARRDDASAAGDGTRMCDTGKPSPASSDELIAVDMTIEGEASSAVYVQDVVGGVVCRARPHAPPLQQLAGMLHMFIGETIRELHGPRERWHYTFAMETLHARIWTEQRQNAISTCSQKIQCSIL